MVRLLLYSSDDERRLPVDKYDCIIVDESHRGYNLDREMSDGELEFRSESDYISKYRRVLDHFDAVRIGLTATPALHTTEIFGRPAYEYSYRQAVIDGYLVDHEPPLRILTKLGEDGIHWEIGEEVTVYRPTTGQVDMFDAPDEIDIDLSGFNTRAITESFNEVVCRKLAEEIDPALPGKTLIFCATDNHADMVVDLMKKAFVEAYGEIDDNAVMKITGAADKPRQKIRLYKNEELPKVAVTVDLLSTGIDVPEITNLVFLRRVKSRILYEQMIGRGTRLCPEIGKEFFRIYDAVDIYAALEDYTTMKPVVTRPVQSFVQLVEELLTVEDNDHCEMVAEEMLVKFHRRKSRIEGAAADQFTDAAGSTTESLIGLLQSKDITRLKEYFRQHSSLAKYLDSLKAADSKPVYVSGHDDEFLRIERGYGDAQRPEDYLEGFKKFVQDSGNQIPALLIVTQRPRDLTREQLKELSLELDKAGYNVSRLRTAWSEVTNQDIAASIVGFIRSQALGSALVPFETRVDRAVKSILAAREWTKPQRSWLERIGSQLRQETIVDRSALDRGQFRANGGFNRLNKIFKGELEQILGDLHEELWKDIA